MRRRCCLYALLAFVTGCTSVKVAWRRDGDLVHVTVRGQPFATVHAGAQPRPFVWPLLGPGGVPMTRAVPPGPDDGTDHPHHVSLWFAHGDVDGFDFWQGRDRRERQVLDGQPEVVAAGEEVRVRCRYRWLAGDDTLVCNEERELVFGGDDAARTVDVVATLRPVLRPLVLGDTKEGTFALRVHPALRVEGKGATGRLANSEGQRDGAVWGKRARWIDAAGTIDGREVGIAMFDHPGNHAHPTWWHARTYGLLAANPFGVHDFEKRPAGSGALTVPPGGELRLAYRVLLHGPGWDRARLDAAWRDWAGR